MLPASRSGTTSTLARPATGEAIFLIAAASRLMALSSASGPSIASRRFDLSPTSCRERQPRSSTAPWPSPSPSRLRLRHAPRETPWRAQDQSRSGRYRLLTVWRCALIYLKVRKCPCRSRESGDHFATAEEGLARMTGSSIAGPQIDLPTANPAPRARSVIGQTPGTRDLGFWLGRPRAEDVANPLCKFDRRVRLFKPSACSKLPPRDRGLRIAGREQDLDRRLRRRSGLRQFIAVHPTGHDDVGKNHRDFGMSRK